MHPNLWAFAAVTVPFVMSPGVSTALVLRNSIAGGVRAGVETAVGVNAGSVLYGLLTAFGVAVLLQRFPLAWTSIRVAGTAYLSWLGIVSLRHAVRGRQPAAMPQGTQGRRPLAKNLSEGFVTNMLNPSIAAFYLLIVPQFVPRSAPVAGSVLILTAAHVSLAIAWHLSWAAAGGTLSATLGRSRPRRVLEGITGVVLLGLAAKVAFG